MTSLRKSNAKHPITQQEARDFLRNNSDMIFEVLKIKIPVQQTKAHHNQQVKTITLARDGRTIAETINTTTEGFGIDTRRCIDGSLDQYAKKPTKVEAGYTIDDGRLFAELMVDETTKAHTKGGEIRKAFVATEDMWLDTTWGEVQHIGKGGLITFSGQVGKEEAIGNNNPCDMVVYTKKRTGHEVLTKPARIIRYDLERSDIEICKGLEKFLRVAAREDMKSPYVSKWDDFRLWMKYGILSLHTRLKGLFKKKTAKLQPAKLSKPSTKRINKER